MKYYKVLNGLRSMHGGHHTWVIGEWVAVTGELVPCKYGIHLCAGAEQIRFWLGPDVYEAEYDGEIIDADDKIVCRRARITRRCERWDMIGFAAACARRVLHIYEGRYPGDLRPRRAIEAAESRIANADAACVADAYDAANIDAYDAACAVDAYDAACAARASSACAVDAYDRDAYDRGAAARAAADAACDAAARAVRNARDTEMGAQIEIIRAMLES